MVLDRSFRGNGLQHGRDRSRCRTAAQFAVAFGWNGGAKPPASRSHSDDGRYPVTRSAIRDRPSSPGISRCFSPLRGARSPSPGEGASDALSPTRRATADRRRSRHGAGNRRRWRPLTGISGARKQGPLESPPPSAMAGDRGRPFPGRDSSSGARRGGCGDRFPGIPNRQPSRFAGHRTGALHGMDSFEPDTGLRPGRRYRAYRAASRPFRCRRSGRDRRTSLIERMVGPC